MARGRQSQLAPQISIFISGPQVFAGVGVGFPLHLATGRLITMSIAKTSEITASSKKSFEDAVREGIKRFSKTIKNVQGAWIKEQKVIVDGDDVSEYRVTMIVTFVLD
jgi:flavin-binding protein dodecin